MTAEAPRICCLDLDTFFVSVERLLDPSLEGKPVIVGGKPGQRGVVTAASYEVRELGVRSGISLTDAAKLAPNAVFVPGRHGAYSEYSQRVHRLLQRACPVVRMASIDEFYLDLHGCERLFARPDDPSPDATIQRAVWELTDAIEREVGLPSSVGIATSLTVSKIASGLAKPRGVLMVPAGGERAFLEPLPVRKFPGIGPVGERKLERIGITTLGQVAALPVTRLRSIFGVWGGRIKRGALGEGNHQLGADRPAFREHDPAGGVVGSISNERTFSADVGDLATIDAMLCSLCERVCWRARKRGIKARTVTLKLRYADFHTLTRCRTCAPTNSELELYPVVKEIYEGARTRSLKIRLLGIALSNLGLFDEQLSLFQLRPHDAGLHRAVDTIREKYGYDAVRVAIGNRRTYRS